MTSRVVSPRNFRSCGISPIDANGKISLPSPISVQPVDDARRADAAVAADAHVLADDRVRADDRAGADRGASDGRSRVGSTRHAGPAARHLAPARAPSPARPRRRRRRRSRRRRARAPACARRAPERDLEPQPVARHHLPPELRVVHAAQVGVARRLAVGCRARRSSVATCASVSIMSTPGISGAPGKCPWKKSSLTVTFLTATSRLPGSCSVTASTSGDG